MCIKKLIIFISSCWLILSIGSVSAQVKDHDVNLAAEPASKDDTDFPGRKTYPYVSTISLEDLYAEYDNVVIVDARSPYE